MRTSSSKNWSCVYIEAEDGVGTGIGVDDGIEVEVEVVVELDGVVGVDVGIVSNSVFTWWLSRLVFSMSTLASIGFRELEDFADLRDFPRDPFEEDDGV